LEGSTASGAGQEGARPEGPAERREERRAEQIDHGFLLSVLAAGGYPTA